MPRVARVVWNRNLAATLPVSAASHDPRPFHRSMRGYAKTPLVRLPEAARELGIADLWVKDETSRLGLPSFKILGVAWAIARALIAPEIPTTFTALQTRLPAHTRTLVAATEGNHGRAVAFVARALGLRARIHVSRSMAAWRRETIAAEGAELVDVAGTYDDAVRSAARDSDGTLIVSDTAWQGYEEVPSWTSEGYRTLFEEAYADLAQASSEVDLAVIQTGVGALAAAAVRAAHPRGCAVTTVEPEAAACALASLERGELTSALGPHGSRMVGLNCGALSTAAWPLLRAGVTAALAIPDDDLGWAVDHLARVGIRAGAAGAAGLAGLAAFGERKPTTRALVIATGGPDAPP